MRFLLRLLAPLMLLAPTPAMAQSSPNLVSGQVLTAAQWNALFASKEDYNPNIGCAFSPCIPPVATAPNAVLGTNSSGTPLFSSTLPPLLSVPSPQFAGTAAGGTLSGTVSIATSGQLSTSNTAPSTSAGTGAVVVTGGLGVGGAIWNAGGIVAGTPAGGNMGAGTINATGIYVNGAAVGTGSGNMVGPSSSTAHNLASYADTGGKTLEDSTSATIGTAAPVALSNTTASTSTTTGALVVGGGLGVGGAANIGGAENLTGVLASSNTTASTSDTTGAITTQGGAGILGNLYVGGNLNVGGTFTAPAPSESANTVYAGPASGSPAGATFRGLAQADLPSITPSGGSVASTLGALAGRIITPMDFGAAGNGVTNDTAAVQSAINSVSAAGASGTLYLGNHKYCITGITISAPIRIVGSGYGSDNGTAPSGFTACSTNPGAMITLGSGSNGSVLEYFGVFPGTDATNAASGSAIVDKASQTSVHDLLIRDACNAIDEIGNTNRYYNLRINGTALQSGCVLIDIGSSTIHSIDPYFVNDTIDDNKASGATATVGMLFENVGGGWISHNDILFMDYGTRIVPGANEIVTGVSFDNTVLGDTTNNDCLDIDTTSSSAQIYALQFNGTWCGSTGNTNHGTGSPVWTAATGLWIANTGGGVEQGVHFVGARVDDIGGSAFDAAGTVSGVTVDDSRFCGGNQANTGLPNAEIDSTATDVAVRNTTSGAQCDNMGIGGPAAVADLNITSGAGNVILTGDHFPDTNTLTGASPASGVIADNAGVDSQEPPIASAATITAPLTPAFSLTGTTTVTTINGGWSGRIVNIIDTNAAALATGGNIASVPASFGTNQLIQCRYIGPDWVCR